jgi:eukaryotic-like serine/threonine-protein kinase
MTLATGTLLGPYEIAEPAGTGGMGDVYRAHDTRLDRDVAVKTIKGPFTERFEREARAISALNHPNICTLYDVGQHDGSGYLVMEYIEGKPIAGPLPVEQAIAYGIQICEALHAAHRKGIVHRDLKPANILLTKQSVKLLDFGLAKLSPNGNSGVLSGSAAHAAEQATVAALTGAHTVVGTPQYMAPEQIEGREVDARTDIFAFGCVLYELLTGQRAFEGKTSSSVMAAILATKPRPIEELVPLTPPALERIVSRCLAKDPEDRWQSARDVAAELQWVSQGGSKVGLPAVVTGRRRVREGIAWAACALISLVAVGFGVAWARRAPEPPALVRFPLLMPSGLSNPSPPVASPDGRKIVFAADGDGKRLIWIRPLDSIDARPLPGTEGVLRPFWSPDSRFVAFFAGGKLKKVDISGGPPQTICEAPNGADGSWNEDGVILFDGRGTDPIWRVPAGGGVAKTEIGVDQKAGIFGVGWPEFLPDGRRFLYMVIGESPQDQMLTVGTLDSKDAKPLFKATSRVMYAAPGYLLFVREHTLVAQRFNLDSLSLEGEAIPLGEGLGVDDVGLASFSVSRNGLLAFRAGELQGRRLVWMDRSGKETPAIDAIGGYRDTSLSPDGKRLAYDATNNADRSDLWIRDLTRGVSSRFTFDSADELNPQWSPDGRRIVFTSRAKGPGDLQIKDASGTREAEPLLVSSDEKYVSDWSRDGRFILFTSRAGDEYGWDIFALPMEGDRKPVPLVKTKFNELFATFSPDGKYIAYHSNESGRPEIYVQEFPEARNKWQVSTEGGVQAFWRADGRELFYRNAARLMAVPVEAGATFTAGTPVELFQTRFAAVTTRGLYRPVPDGQRFLVLAPLAREAEQPASVVLNWTAALKN